MHCGFLFPVNTRRTQFEKYLYRYAEFCIVEQHIIETLLTWGESNLTFRCNASPARTSSSLLELPMNKSRSRKLAVARAILEEISLSTLAAR
jgi:hypothetical protein